MRIGVEVGGTFTDLVWEHEGEVGVVKVPSTPSHPDEGALAALDRVPGGLGALDDLVHGSTVATNAILERKGARLGLLVTRGTRDLLLLQRHNRSRIYDLGYRKPEPVVARRDVLEIDERVDAAGAVVTPLDREEAERALREWLGERDIEALAICLLNSYANDAHERTLAELAGALAPELAVTCSSAVAREFREYERCTTATLSAYVQPVMASYLRRFGEALSARGYAGPFSVMQSNGGRLPAEAMASGAIRALFSGPAAGVIGAVSAAARSGYRNLISLDMGGTSTDVCLVEGSEPTLTGMVEIDGLPIKTPVIDMVTVGAGGGSIVWIDDGGMLRVGPRSAGASPGPACYGRGGQEATVTDAHLVRGTLQADALLGGEMHADEAAARSALERVAASLGVGLLETADSAIRVAEANIVRAIQRVSTERGRDPRGYVLVPYGGAGPMLAARLAEDLDIATVLVPPHAGVLSAYGLLASDYLHFETRTRRLTVDAGHLPAIESTLAEMTDAVTTQLAALGLRGAPRMAAVLEMRYAGQAFEIPVALRDFGRAPLTVEALREAFNEAHRQVFEFDKGTHGECEVVSFRVSGAIAPARVPAFAPVRKVGGDAPPEQWIEITERGVRKRCRKLGREALPDVLAGPAIVADTTSTLYVPEGWRVRQDEHANLVMSREGDTR